MRVLKDREDKEEGRRVLYDGEWENDGRKGKGRVVIEGTNGKGENIVVYEGVWNGDEILGGSVRYFQGDSQNQGQGQKNNAV